MGWEELKVAAEYDGDQHRTNRKQYVKDIRCQAKLQRLGWVIVRVIAEDREDDIIGRVDDLQDFPRALYLQNVDLGACRCWRVLTFPYCGGMPGGGYTPRKIHAHQSTPNSTSSLAS
jgi:hypothetical protein